MNDTKLTGRLGADPVLRHTANGVQVTNLRLAVERPNSDDPDWFDVTVWGATAEAVATHLGKGDQLIVDGHLRPDHIELDGKKYATVTIHADRVEFAARAQTL